MTFTIFGASWVPLLGKVVLWGGGGGGEVDDEVEVDSGDDDGDGDGDDDGRRDRRVGGVEEGACECEGEADGWKGKDRECWSNGGKKVGGVGKEGDGRLAG